MLGLIGNAIGGIFGAISGAQQAKQEKDIADQNYELQREQFEYQKELNDRQFNYQKELNDKQMQREDNAVQRRAKDLEAAGLSKTLAAGSSASAGGMSSGGAQTAGNAPQRQSTLNAGVQALQRGTEIAGQVQSINMGNAQTNLTQEQAQTENTKRENIKQDTQNKVSEKALTEANKTLVDKQASNYEKKLAQEIKESNMRINKMQVDNQLTEVNKNLQQNKYNYENQTGVPLEAIKSGTIASQLGLDVANYSQIISKQLGTIVDPRAWKQLGKNIIQRFK